MTLRAVHPVARRRPAIRERSHSRYRPGFVARRSKNQGRWNESGRPSVQPEVLDVLTTREREVMTLAAFGLSNDEIAERLYLSPLTAKTHANRAMMKLGVRDRAQLVVLAFQTGLVQPGDAPPV